MKVLMLSSRVPYPLTAGFRIRIYNEAKYFKRNGHSVDLLFLGTKEEYEEYYDSLKLVFENIYYIHFNKLEAIKKTLFSVFTNKPLQVALYQNKTFEKKLLEIESEYDLIIGNHIRTSEYLSKIDKDKTVLDLHDAISYNYFNAIRVTKGIKKLIYRIEYDRVLKYESNVVSLFPKTVLVSHKDKEWLSDNGADVKNVSVIPVAVRDDIIDQKHDYSNDDNIICFLGKMSYQPNVDAVVWFAKKIMPKLLLKYPDLLFYVLGIDPTAEIVSLAEKNKNIIVTGFVDNPYEVIAKAKATVVPIRNGAGVQNKVLESMFVGTPVVSSEIAADGIQAINNNQLFVAKNEDEFLNYLCKLLDSVELRKTIGESGKKFIEEHYTWNSLWGKWDTLINNS